MIRSNLRQLLEARTAWSPERGAIVKAWDIFRTARPCTQEAVCDFAEVLEQNVAQISFRNEVLPLLLEAVNATYAGVDSELVERAYERALARTVLAYDWEQVEPEMDRQLPLHFEPKELPEVSDCRLCGATDCGHRNEQINCPVIEDRTW